MNNSSEFKTKTTEQKNHNSFIDVLSEKIQTQVAPFLKDAGTELSHHVQNMIKTTLQNQGLVTREMFDIQCALLAKTRLKLQQLEMQLTNIEAHNTQYTASREDVGENRN